VQEADKRGLIITKITQICAYANYIARTEQDLKKTYQKLEEDANKLGLETHFSISFHLEQEN